MFHDIDDSEPLKIFNFKGEKIKEIKESNEKTFFVDTFIDIKTLKNYIITGNNNYLKSYDYKNNELFHKYFDSDTGVHISIIINEDKEIIRLIESCSDGNIRIWNFHSAELLNKIKVHDDWLFGICLWNNDYLFVACKDKIIRLIQIREGLIVKYLEGHQHGIFSMKKISIPKYGECLLSQGYDIDQIKLWVDKKFIK
jgi:WD40 repeat protein